MDNEKRKITAKELNEMIEQRTKELVAENNKARAPKSIEEAHVEFMVEKALRKLSVEQPKKTTIEEIVRRKLEEKANAERTLNRHEDTGYVIVSAERKDATPEENKANTNKLASEIQSNNLSFKKVYGGYVNDFGTGQQTQEESFMIFPFTTTGAQFDFESLKQFAIQLCGKYGQECVLAKIPDGDVVYYKADGTIDMNLGKDVKFNDKDQEYFTNFHKLSNPDKVKPDGRPTRFTYGG